MRRASPLLLVLVLMVGCRGNQRPDISPYVAANELGWARHAMQQNLTDDRNDRQYLLDRMGVGVLALADGYPDSAGVLLEDVYDTLRTQGINRDRTVASVVINEGVKIWKGEPFEQALGFNYVGLQQATVGSWDNARAAYNNSLFYLRDFGQDESTGQRLDTQQIAERALAYERAIASGASEEQAQAEADYLDSQYVPVESNFTLGYFMRAVSNQQLGLDDEAEEDFLRVLTIDPGLASLVDAFRTGEYNTVLVVSWGLGPEKEAYGPDRALARFTPRSFSDSAPLIVRAGNQKLELPIVTDVNTMARDHMWNNLEDVRKAKSFLGNVLVAGGTIAIIEGLDHDSSEAVAIGAAAVLAGALLKAGAKADTRYCEVLPQRYYLVPLWLDGPTTVDLEVAGRPASRLVLNGLDQPATPGAQLRYIRLNSGYNTPPWMTSGNLLYDTDAHPLDHPQPYVMGGNSVRLPSADALRAYQANGYLTGYTVNDLNNLYREEGLHIERQQTAGVAGLHVLEGGDSLVSPIPGSVGYQRLFAQPHAPYRPRTSEARHLAQP